MNEFDRELNKLFKSMIEVAFEYVNFNEEEVKIIYIFCSLEEGYYFDFFYNINNTIVKKHQVNEVLEKKSKITDEKQLAALDIGLAEIAILEKLFKDDNNEIPKQVKLNYSISEDKYISNISYEQKLIGTEKMDTDLRDDWIKELIKK
jgi:hypothetical protein